MKYLIQFCFFFCFFCPSYVIAQPNHVTIMSVCLKEKKSNFLLALTDKFVRFDKSENVYYIIDLETQNANIINRKRKTITKTTASNAIKNNLPPLKILTGKKELQYFLKQNHAIKQSLPYQEKEIWLFNHAGDKFLVEVYLPEFYPNKIELFHNDKKLTFELLKKVTLPLSKVDPLLFEIPQNYKIIDLVSK